MSRNSLPSDAYLADWRMTVEARKPTLANAIDKQRGKGCMLLLSWNYYHRAVAAGFVPVRVDIDSRNRVDIVVARPSLVLFSSDLNFPRHKFDIGYMGNMSCIWFVPRNAKLEDLVAHYVDTRMAAAVSVDIDAIHSFDDSEYRADLLRDPRLGPASD